MSKANKRLLEQASAVDVAMLVDRGFVDTTPLDYTARGRRFIRTMSRRRRRELENQAEKQ
ncbi:MAG: hypothetical protein AB7O57_04605 [Hyphomicrobiaceae bacterium]